MCCVLVAGYLFIPAFTAKWSRNAVCRVGQLSVLSPDATATYEHFTELIRRYEIIWRFWADHYFIHKCVVQCHKDARPTRMSSGAVLLCGSSMAWCAVCVYSSKVLKTEYIGKRKKDTGEKGKGKQGELQLKEERMC